MLTSEVRKGEEICSLREVFTINNHAILIAIYILEFSERVGQQSDVNNNCESIVLMRVSEDVITDQTVEYSGLMSTFS